MAADPNFEKSTDDPTSATHMDFTWTAPIFSWQLNTVVGCSGRDTRKRWCLPRNVIDGILCPVGGDAGTWELRNRDMRAVANVRRRTTIVNAPHFLVSGRSWYDNAICDVQSGYRGRGYRRLIDSMAFDRLRCAGSSLDPLSQRTPRWIRSSRSLLAFAR